MGGPRAREVAIARIQFIRTFNGAPIEDVDRKDNETVYLNDSLRQCLLHYQALAVAGSEEIKLEELEDPRLMTYM